MKNSTIYGSVIKAPNFKQGQKVGPEELIAAIDRLYDKRYPVVPNARKGEQQQTKVKKKK